MNKLILLFFLFTFFPLKDFSTYFSTYFSNNFKYSLNIIVFPIVIIANTVSYRSLTFKLLNIFCILIK